MVSKLERHRAPLNVVDPEVADIVLRETERQEYGLELIPSENFVSEAVLAALGSVLTNKYAEGRPGRRYYGGCHVVDDVERLARDRAKALFGAEFADLQPHSGAQANQAVYEAVLEPGDTVLGMRLDQGGHLTHGSPVNFSGKHYRVVAYGVSEADECIDYEELATLAAQHRPKMIIAGATAYSRKIDFAAFRRIADDCGAVLLSDVSHYAGLIAGGVYPSPVEHSHLVSTTTHKTLRGPRSGMVMGLKDYGKAVRKAVFPGLQGGPHMHVIAAKAVALKEAATEEFRQYAQAVVANARELCSALANHGFRIVSGGTDSHLLLVDLRPAGVTGKDAEELLDSVNITVNKNGVPFDSEPPMVTSGIRLGTPAITTRGMGVAEMKKIAEFIARAVEVRSDQAKLDSLRDEVRDLSASFPLYSHRLVK